MQTTKTASLKNLSYASKNASFLGCPETDLDNPENAKAVIVPFGFEKTVSYGKGTNQGPMAIIRASQELELFDEEYFEEPYLKYRIATLKDISIPNDSKKALEKLQKIIEKVLEEKKFPFTFGGEHSITSWIIKAFSKNYKNFTILHFDAHADLRDSYEENPFSHACAMRRALDEKNVSLVSVGIRNISQEEILYLEKNSNRIKIFWSKDQKDWKIEEILKSISTNEVYISFDVDVFDASIMPATGTPEPGGLDWFTVINILKAVSQKKNIIGADLVEFAPIKKFHAYDFLVAKLVYKMLNYALM